MMQICEDGACVGNFLLFFRFVGDEPTLFFYGPKYFLEFLETFSSLNDFSKIFTLRKRISHAQRLFATTRWSPEPSSIS